MLLPSAEPERASVVTVGRAHLQIRRKHRLYSSKQNTYWEAKVVESRSNPVKLWKNLSEIMRREKPRAPATDGLSAQCFSDAFADKINKVRSATAADPEPSSKHTVFNAQFNAFKPVDPATVRRASTKNCELDPVPTWIVKQYVNELAPFLTTLVNASFRDGSFPSTQKCAVVTLALKKSTLDPFDLSNYRPISNLTFVSKLLQRC